MSSRMMYLLEVTLSSPSAIMFGMRSLVRMYANTFAKATSAIMAAALDRVWRRQA